MGGIQFEWRCKRVTSFLHGEKKGAYIELDSNGQYIRLISYHNDVRHGAYVEYNYPNKKEERLYQNGKLDGM